MALITSGCVQEESESSSSESESSESDDEGASPKGCDDAQLQVNDDDDV